MKKRKSAALRTAAAATIEIPITDKNDGDLIRAGLNDPDARAVVKIIGALSKLPTSAGRRRAIIIAAGLLPAAIEEPEHTAGKAHE